MRKTRIFFIALCIIVISLSGCSPSPTKEEAKPNGTITFINATYALITVDNGVDPKLFGGVEPSSANAEMMKEVLQDSWSITDAASAESTIQWLLTEGHNAEFMAYMDEYLARKEMSILHARMNLMT